MNQGHEPPKGEVQSDTEGQSDDRAQPADSEEAAAGIEALIAEVGPDKAREMLELLLTELVVKSDPESEE